MSLNILQNESALLARIQINKLLEWSGCTFGLIGAALLALNNVYSGFGFVAFLMSNVCWIMFARRIKAAGLLLMQIGFTATSLFGIARWFF